MNDLRTMPPTLPHMHQDKTDRQQGYLFHRHPGKVPARTIEERSAPPTILQTRSIAACGEALLPLLTPQKDQPKSS
jgi:hypothetical protein